jgi:hypothetical protein
MREGRGRHISPARSRASRGVTLIEVQIAALLGVLAFLTIVDYSRVQDQLVSSVEDERWADGSVDATNERFIVVATSVGSSAAEPVCEVRMTSVTFGGLYPTAEVVVRQRGL